MRAARRGLAVLAVLAAVSAAVLVGLLPLFGFRVLVVRGASMGAAAPLGSVVVGEGRPASAVGVGDVIVMRPVAEERRGAPVMHRVVRLRVVDGQRVVTTKGDALRHGRRPRRRPGHRGGHLGVDGDPDEGQHGSGR